MTTAATGGVRRSDRRGAALIRAYYNEIDPFACEWLRELMKDGLISEGDIDERSITEVDPQDLRGYTRLHFFAGTGGWELALNLAGWGDRPAMSGSPPCQPFSVAGKGEGFGDERHLFPAWFRLIKVCRPPVIFGEQVESAIKHGWLDLVFGDLERMSYAVASLVFKACAVGAPHQRERLYWVADAGALGNADHGGQGPDGGGAGADAEREAAPEDVEPRLSAFWSDARWIGCRDGKLRPVPPQPGVRGVGDGLPSGVGRGCEADRFPLCGVTPNRTQRLKGYGNAIVPQAGAAFVRAFMETRLEATRAVRCRHLRKVKACAAKPAIRNRPSCPIRIP